MEMSTNNLDEIVIEPIEDNSSVEVKPIDNQNTDLAEVKSEAKEEVVIEDLPQEPEQVESVLEEEKPAESEQKYEEIVVLLKQYFNALRDSIRLAKTKDETIVKMKNELNKYREDFGYTLLKQIIMSLISYREDAKNTWRY